MAKHDRKGRSKRHFAGQFIGLETGMMDSPAWRHLSGQAQKLFLDVWKRYNGQIPYSVREAAEYLRCGKNTSTKLFQENIDKGFLAIGTKGAFSVKTKAATTWRVTLIPSGLNGRELATRDYQRWRPTQTVPPTGTEATPKKQNTVPPRGTDGLSLGDRECKTEDKNGVTVPPTGTVIVDSMRPRSLPEGHYLDSTIPGGTDVLSAARALGVQRARAASGPRSSALRLPSKAANAPVEVAENKILPADQAGIAAVPPVLEGANAA